MSVDLRLGTEGKSESHKFETLLNIYKRRDEGNRITSSEIQNTALH